MRALILCIALGVMSGCIPSTDEIIRDMYSVAENGKSEFDGTRWIRVKNIYCHPITFDLYQDTNLAKANMVALSPNIQGAPSIRSGKSLHLNIDGTFIDLTTLEQLTSIETKPGYYVRCGYAVLFASV